MKIFTNGDAFSMEKTMPSGAFRATQDFSISSYFEVLPPGIHFEDLFQPQFWFHHQERFRKFDEVRVRSSDGSFDVRLTVAKVVPGGVRMEYLGGRAPAGLESFKEIEDAAKSLSQDLRLAPMDKQGAPIPRTEYLDATKWRVIGVDNNEVRRGFESKAEAQAYLASYLDDLNMRLPSDEEGEQHRNAQPKPASAHDKPSAKRAKARA